MIRISGRVHGYALVFAQNESTGDIVGKETDSTGKYELMMEAAIGDRIAVWESFETKESDRIVVVVPEKDPLTGLGGAPPQ